MQQLAELDREVEQELMALQQGSASPAANTNRQQPCQGESLPVAQFWVEGVAYGIAEEVEGEHGE